VVLSNITSRIVVQGQWLVYASCSYIGPSNTAVNSLAYLQIVEFWKQPPSFPPQEDGQFVNVAALDVDGGWCPTNPAGRNNREWILNKSYDVGYSALQVPPKGVVLFDMRLRTIMAPFITHDGAVDILCSIVCPFVQFEVKDAIQSGPPI
jgi:hypothetical protein